MLGPTGPVSHGSLFSILEWHTRYMFLMINKLQTEYTKYVLQSETRRRERPVQSYARAHEASLLVICLSLVVQEREDSWPGHGYLSREPLALF